MPNKKKDGLLSFQDLIDNLAEVLQEWDGEAVAELYNQVCSDEVEYAGDSLWRKKP